MRIFWSILCLMSLTACTAADPFERPGTWHITDETSSNAANLRAMIVNPHDLEEGRGETTSVGVEASAPIHRLFTGNRYLLPNSNTLQDLGAGSAAAPPPPVTGTPE